MTTTSPAGSSVGTDAEALVAGDLGIDARVGRVEHRGVGRELSPEGLFACTGKNAAAIVR